MSVPSRNESPFLARISAPSFLALSAAIFAGYYYTSSYNSARPDAARLQWGSGAYVERIEALITQDPIDLGYQRYAELDARDAADSAMDEQSLETHRLPSGQQCRSRLCIHAVTQAIDGTSSDSRLLVLFESARAGARPEDREHRTRARYATVAGLTAAGFHPVDAQHISIFKWRPQPEAITDTRELDVPTNLVIAPYEWFEANEPGARKFDRVLLIWIDEDAAGTGQASLVKSLIEAFERGCSNANVSKFYRMVGPTTSNELAAFAKDVNTHFDPMTQRTGNWTLKVLSPYATAPDEFIPELEKLQDLSRADVTIMRTIGTDDALADLLVYELEQRVPELMDLGAEPPARSDGHQPGWTRILAAPLARLRLVKASQPGKRVRIALVTEQDSTYGRAWCKNIANAIQRSGDSHPPLAEVELHSFPFLSHIDGKAPAAAPAQGASDTFEPDYPLRAQQIDYLRRLESELASGGEPYAAIGIFGTDDFDKLMILEALRPKFPAAFFFTTDLDARYTHPRHAAYTRNLVIASHFGLDDIEARPEPDPEFPVRVDVTPKFRDGYQTAVFRSVRDLARADDSPRWKSPRVFEIGRSAAVELNVQLEQVVTDPPCRADILTAERVHPRRRFAIPWREAELGWWEKLELHLGALSFADVHAGTSSKEAQQTTLPVAPEGGGAFAAWVAVAVLAVCIFLGLIGLLGKRPRDSFDYADPPRHPRWKFFVSIVAMLAALVAMSYAASEAARRFPAEPTALTQGVSVWPTVALRIAMSVFALVSMISIQRTLRRAHNGIGDTFGLIEHLSSPRGRRWDAFAAWMRKSLHLPDAPAVSSGRTTWGHLGQGMRAPWWFWPSSVVFGCATFFLLAPFFVLHPPPPPPTRGPFAYVIERGTLLLNLITYFTLMAAVIHLTMRNVWLMSRILDAGRNPPVVDPADARARHLDWKRRLTLARSIAQAVEPTVYPPAIVLGLMILARASIFDSWSWPPALVGVLSLCFVLLFLCVISMRRVAKRAKQRTLESLYDERVRHATNDAVLKPLQWIIAEVEDFRGAAFSPLVEHPFVRAAFLPLAAFGTSLALERELFSQVLAHF